MKNRIIEIKWAFIFIIVQLFWMLIEKLTGLHDVHIDKHAIYTNFFAIPAILVYVLALLEKRRKDLGGYMTYKNGLISGLIITGIVTVLTPLGQYITLKLITPEYFPNVIEFVTREGKMTQEAAEAYFNFKSYVIQSVIGALVMGVVTSAIVAIFIRRAPDKAEPMKE